MIRYLSPGPAPPAGAHSPPGGRQGGTVRLLTLTGPGGIGKTRLAIEAAAALAPGFAGGVRFVSLEPIADPAMVVAVTAQALGVPETPSVSLLEGLRDFLRDRQMLLVFDNFEHVISAAPLVADLLEAAPRLTVLATSRESLRLPGEQEFPVPPLALPCRDPLPPLEALSESAAVALFLQRARAVQPDFVLTRENAAAVAEICCHLDGLPLAIELAAARVKALPVAEIAARMDHGLHLLTAGSRTAPARHQSLHAALDWSYELLSSQERTLFARLAVFRGSFSLEAAEAICGDDRIAVLDLLVSLVDKSLVVMQEHTGTGGTARYRLLEVIGQYALELLAESGEEEIVRDRHLAYFLKLGDDEVPPHGGQTVTPLQAAKERHGQLTAREWQVAELIAQGRRNAAIAAALVIEERTVESHITHILTKLGLVSRTQLAAWTIQRASVGREVYYK